MCQSGYFSFLIFCIYIDYYIESRMCHVLKKKKVDNSEYESESEDSSVCFWFVDLMIDLMVYVSCAVCIQEDTQIQTTDDEEKTDGDEPLYHRDEEPIQLVLETTPETPPLYTRPQIWRSDRPRAFAPTSHW